MIDRFSFLNATINIIVIDAHTNTSLVSLEQLFEPFRCCRIHKVTSNAEALVLLRSGIRFHVCCTELGIEDVDQDEFIILRQYAHHSSIMVITAQNSAEKGANCIMLGARAVFDRTASIDRQMFASRLSYLTLINIVNHRYNEAATDSYSLATRILFDKNPESVTEWAEQMRISDRQLRNLWHAGSGFGVKHLLFLYSCYRDAFHYYALRYSDNNEEQHASSLYFKKQYLNYFESHRELLHFLLN